MLLQVPAANCAQSWTLAFYLADGKNFYTEQQDNVKEICSAIPENVNLVFLHDRNKNGHGKSGLKDITYISDCKGLIPLENTDTYSEKQLKRFFEFVRSKYKSDRYFYSITAHGVPPYMNDKDSLNAVQIRKAVKGLEPDVLGLDMCYMGSIESLLVLNKSAEYIISASTTLPAAGNDYSAFVGYFSKHSEISPENAARAYLNGYKVSYAKNNLPLTVFITKTGDSLSKTAVLFSKKVLRLKRKPYNILPENPVTLFGINGDFTELLKYLKIDSKDTFTEIYSVNASLKGVAVYFPSKQRILNQTLYGYRFFLKQNRLDASWADRLGRP